MTGGGVIGTAALVGVAIGLAITAIAQVRPLRRGRAALDTLGIVPEWRFYAQASIDGAADLARDTHIVVRERDAPGRPGGWAPVLWPAERRLLHGLWNPRARVDTLILSVAEDLATAHRRAPGIHVQQSLGYLVVLRRALEAPGTASGADRQFAVVHASGRGRRTASIDFLSSWHR